MSYFYGLPRPKDFKARDVQQALLLAQRKQEVQLITRYQLEGEPQKHCNINLTLFKVLYAQSGLTHSGEQVLEEGEETTTIGRRPRLVTLVEDARLRYDYYTFTEYGKDILEYYHLIFLSQEEGVEMVHERAQSARYTKAALLQSITPVPASGSPLLSEEFTGAENGPDGALAEQEQLLRQTWGSLAEGLQLRRHPVEFSLVGLYHERLDFGFTLRQTQVSGSLYLLHKVDGNEAGFVPYVQVKARGTQTYTFAALLDDDQDVDLGLDEFIGLAMEAAEGGEVAAEFVLT
jgi:hypothetical protein